MAKNDDQIGKKLTELSGRELLMLVLLAFFGGNTSGSVIFAPNSSHKEQLQRIERKLDKAQSEQDALKDSISELKHQVRELQIRSGLLWPQSKEIKKESKK